MHPPLTKDQKAIVKIYYGNVYDQVCVVSYEFGIKHMTMLRSSHPGMFLRKGVLKIYSILTGEHPCQSVISIKLQSTFIEITLLHGCSSVNLLHIFRKPITKNTSGWLLLDVMSFGSVL